ncbi:MAG: hypothetical protein R3181_08420 [Rubricoccaceae bacterium]|nr:hypothetical protein [Rubricoccaceae bacterium]
MLLRLLLAAALLAGCRGAGTLSPGAVAIPSPEVVPAGTALALRLEQPLGLANDVGDPFRATVASLVVTEGGALVVPSGTAVVGTVTGRAASDGERPGALRLAFEHLRLGGEEHRLAATVLQTDAVAEGGRSARGRVLDTDALPPATGTVVSLGMDRGAARLPLGTLLLVTTDRPIVLR